MAKAQVSITFQIYQGGELVRTETLTEEVIKVGRLPSSHLRLEDDNVSRMHSVIEVGGPDEVYIIDLGSASGTLVNGQKVNKAKLQSGDEVQLGDTKLVVQIAEVAAEAGSAAPAPSVPAPAPTAGLPNPFAAPAAQAPAAGLPNPFAAPAAQAPAVPEATAEDPEQVTYQIVASGPPVSPAEVETTDPAIEVVLMWGGNVLHVAHLSPPRRFVVGETNDWRDIERTWNPSFFDRLLRRPSPGIDYPLAADVTGVDRLPLVLDATAGGVNVLVPEGSSGTVNIDGQSYSLQEMEAQGKLQMCGEVPGAKQLLLPTGATATIDLGAFRYVVRPTAAGKPIGKGFQPDLRPLAYIAGSAVFFSIFLILFYFAPIESRGLSLDQLDPDSRLVKFLMEPPETQEEETPEWLQDSKQDDKEGGTGKRHKGEEGQMGKRDSKKTRNRYGIKGPADNPDPHMAREQAKEMARTAGILGTLRAMTGSWNAPTSPYGRDTALGNDPMSALGALMGDQIGENFGFGGLGLRGTGRGGGGTGEGTIGLGNLGTIGHGAGGGTGSGYGRGAGGFRGRGARVPRIRQGTAEVRGSLSKEVIRRVVRRHINEVKFCYEQELNKNPDLEGRVVVKFIIAASGAVQSAVVASSSIHNSRVENCVVQAVRRWTFPKPEGGGIVIVRAYPFVLSAPGG